MLTRERPSAPPKTGRPSGWPETRFWIGTFGVFVTTLVLALAATAFGLALTFGYSPLVVVSGSMEPHISVGDIVLYEQRSGIGDIAPGAVVVFDDPTGDGGTVVHRVVSVDAEAGWVQTKGDANRAADSSRVTEDMVEGVGRILIPYAGLPAAWMQTGRVLPAVTLIGFIVASAWAARWGWHTRFDPWAKQVVEERAA